MTTRVLPRFGHRQRAGVALAAAISLFGLSGCSGGSGDTGNAAATGDADLVRVVVGRLVDVYGLRTVASGGTAIELFESDVVIGPEIVDERDGNSRKTDPEITYDFLAVDPDSLQQRLLITREIGGSEFKKAFDRLDDNALVIDPATFGQDTSNRTFSIVPRNAGMRLDFSKDLGVTEDFFLAKDQNGAITGIKNPEAVQLLEIIGDPRDNTHTGDYKLIESRIAYKGNRIVLDPVILGNEGKQYALKNTAKGLPESPNSTGANIRLAISLEGPLRLRGLRPRGANLGFVGTNLAARKSLIRDFRSGNANDSNQYVSNGFVRDETPPRLVGEMAMRLERVDIRESNDQRLVLYKAGIKHEFDRGDVLKLFPVNSTGKAITSTEITVDPVDDANLPEEQHVVVRVRDAAEFAKIDPSKRPDYPTNVKEREAWLIKNAPIVVLATEFNGEKDDPLNFITFSPKPDPDPGKDTVALNRNVAPSASVIIRFSKPIDLASVRPLDSLILATLEDSNDLLDPKLGTAHLILSQIFDEDGSQTALRISPPFGFYIDDEMRKAANKDRFPYYLHAVGGQKGIRDLSGKPLDFQRSNSADIFVSFPFYLDTNAGRHPNKRVATIARRFLDQDEDEDTDGFLDHFGAVVYQNGQISGRPTSRLSAFVDDRNQLPSPPNPPLSYCPGGQTATLTGATPFGQPIQNPLNPLGGRLQTLWREIDLSLSRTNPFDFNLDVEGMWWAPFQATQSAPKTSFDIFDRITLYVGHSERRPSPCVTIPGSLPAYTQSGLGNEFYHNFLRDLKKDATNPRDRTQIADRQDPHAAFRDKPLTIRNEDSVFDPTGVNRFLPLPKFEGDLYVWRDERLTMSGGGRGDPRVLSPFKAPFGEFWDNARWNPITVDGQVGSIALPLLVDFWVYPDDPDLPKDDPWKATGFNGWQISLTVQSSPLPYWRAYSGGGRVGTQDNKVNPATESRAQGGYNPITGGRTPWGDNSCYWCCLDFRKSIAVLTSGFVSLEDPHNDAKKDYKDPRLGPYKWTNDSPRFETFFDPPLSQQPVGTKILAEYRAADKFGTNAIDKPYDPLIAGNAHIRDYDSSNRDWESYMHTQNLTKYRDNPNDLFDAEWLRQFTTKGNPLTPAQVKLMNWRFIFVNNVKATPPAVSRLDSFAISIVYPDN